MRTLPVVGAAALALACAPSAHALDTTKPEPCNGTAQITDKPDDTHHDHMEVKRSFLRWAGGELTANVQVKKLGYQVDHAQYRESIWRFVYEAGGTRYYVGATYTRDAADAVYEYGTLDGSTAAQATFNRLGGTTGRFFTGDDGVLQIAIPAEAKGMSGATIERSFVITAEGNSVLDPGERDYFDRAPGGTDWTDPKETTFGDPFVVEDCGAGILVTTGPATVTYGRDLRFRGRVLPQRGGVGVEIVHKETGEVVTTGVTKEDGAFGVDLRPRRTGSYFARAGHHKSGDVLLTVRPRVTMRARRKGGAVRFAGRVAPDLAGTVDIEKRAGGQWIVVAEAKLRRGRFVEKVRKVGRGRYRATFAPAGTDVRGASRVRRLR